MSSSDNSESESSGSGDNYLRFSSSASLDSLNAHANNRKYKNTCDIVPALINFELEKLRKSSSIISQRHLSDKSSIYNLVSTIRLVGSKLDHITVVTKTKKILIVTKIYDIGTVLDTLQLVKYISQSCPNVELYVQDELMKIKEFNLSEVLNKSGGANGVVNNVEQNGEIEITKNQRIKFWSANSCKYNPDTFDLIITLGGDGTILFTSWLFQELIPPVLSFSLGSLGFLTSFNFADHKEVLDNVLQNGYQCSIRTRFQCTVMKSKKHHCSLKSKKEKPIDQKATPKAEIHRHSIVESEEISLKDVPDLSEELSTDERINETHFKLLSYSVFNDIVVDRGPNPTMTSIDLYSDNELLTNVEADGCVIATPCGSTAYSLSAGGSLVHPEIPGILISPICPHSLSFRPLVIPESIILRLGVPYDARVSAWCSFDGKNRIELEPGDFITVTTSRFPIPFVKNTTSKNEWFKRISDTLHWNERKRQKPFNNLDVDK